MKEVYDTLELKARRLPRTKTPRARRRRGWKAKAWWERMTKDPDCRVGCSQEVNLG